MVCFFLCKNVFYLAGVNVKVLHLKCFNFLGERVMKKFLALASIMLLASNANAFDLASMANKVQSVAEKTSAKIEEVQTTNENKSVEAQNKIEEKIAELKEKIVNWQSSESADTDATKQAIANAKASIEKLMEQLKALKATR